MIFKRLGNWLLTPSGKRFSFGVVATVGISVVSLKTLPNTVFLDKYEAVVRFYKDGKPVLLPDVLQERFEKTINLIEVEQDKRKLFKPFTVSGFDTFHAGSAFTPFGAIIGIPINFVFLNINDIDKTIINVNDVSVPWGSEEATQLLNTLILSENAQLYAIAREIKTAESPKLMLDVLYLALAVTTCYGLSNVLNKKFNFYAKSRMSRIVLYALVAGLAFSNYIFAKDFTQFYYEGKVDEFLKEKGPIFSEGGSEYYGKVLQKNKILRKLLGKEGVSPFNLLGSDNFLLKRKYSILEHRKEFFEDKLVS